MSTTDHTDLNEIITSEISQLQTTIRRLTNATYSIKEQLNCDPSNNHQNLDHSSTLDEIDYLQMQINNINQKLTSLLSLKNVSDVRYQQLVSEVDNIYVLLENNYSSLFNYDCDTHNNNTSQNTSTCCYKQLVFTDPSEEYCYMIDNSEITMIFVTMVGGGGGGGIGYVDQFYYYSGGGGGAGSVIFKAPITVNVGCVVKIKVGKGGDTCANTNGGESYVKVVCPNGESNTITVSGGINAGPSINPNNEFSLSDPNLSTSVDGGDGGSGETSALTGESGGSGEIAVPSFPNPEAGSGGDSAFSIGGSGGSNTSTNTTETVHCAGNGGSNLFSRGGRGAKSTDTSRIGRDGKFGSGGGGSLPRIITNTNLLSNNEKLSGLGGDGLVIIEYSTN